MSGRPIPTAKTPTSDILEHYLSARQRGYLADPEEIIRYRYELSQKYGYKLPELSDKIKSLEATRKHKLQIFYGLEPGWIVNLADREIIKPTDERLTEYYRTESML